MNSDLKTLEVLMPPQDLERVLFLKSKILNSRMDIIEVGDIILTNLRSFC